jgi:hypothetical protein
MPLSSSGLWWADDDDDDDNKIKLTFIRTIFNNYSTICKGQQLNLAKFHFKALTRPRSV